MHLKSIQLNGFKSFARKSELTFTSPIAGIVGPNGSGKSNAAEAFRFVLGEQSMKAMRGKRGPDMIWTGNDKLARANRARVAVSFDNKSKLFDIDFDEVVLERIVHRDGANEYSINGSKARLKDIAALLSSANIGASGHHIISQGEADRILGASEKDRREMIEEALGLKTYHYKKAESEKKLAKTSENVKEVKILRREIAPHLKFLEKQMKKLERSRELKRQIAQSYTTYIAHERAYILKQEAALQRAQTEPAQALEKIKDELQRIKEPKKATSTSENLQSLDERMRDVAVEKSTLEHTRGRVEGQLSLVANSNAVKNTKAPNSIPFGSVEDFLVELREGLDTAKSSEESTATLEDLIARVEDFLKQHRGKTNDEEIEDTSQKELKAALEGELREAQEALSALESEEATLLNKRADEIASIAQQQEKERESQKRFFELKEQKRDIERQIEDVTRERASLEKVKEMLTSIEWKAQDKGIQLALLHADGDRSRDEQEEALRDIERIEARLEESGFVDEDTVREYEETEQRDAFLEREVEDLEKSKQTLIEVIANLDDELTGRFDEGLEKINSEFQKFFEMLFDGGSSKLKLVTKVKRDEEGEEEESEEKDGIEIAVQLPRKKVTTLDVLSGGERALTSIALIFAMSQVNPPPFIILDETDAALDEANSRKYANMVKALSAHSQLILITHNRQTMEAAGELYGVTMGNDGISKLLSVKFDEAASVAK